MNIAVIGSGNIGGTLGKSWAKKGHRVKFGSRDPYSVRMNKLLQDTGDDASAASVEEAIAFGDVILLAVPGTEIESALRAAGDLQQKILINSTMLFDGRSAEQEVQRHAQNARIVRAFNTVTWEVLANPSYGLGKATIFLTGEDSEAKSVVAQLCHDIGLDPLDAGETANNQNVEMAVGLLWNILSPQFGRDYALQVLRREPVEVEV